MMSFRSPEEFREWLIENHESSEGIWLQFYKKGSGVVSITYAQALDEALCFGWIDGQLKKHDEKSYLHRFTPRRAKSIWSKINTQHTERLIREGRMAPAGYRQIELAKADGRWHAAYDSYKDAKPPEDFMKELAKNPTALEFFQGLSKANVYAIVFRLQTAKKPETRARRLQAILEMLARKEKFH